MKTLLKASGLVILVGTGIGLITAAYEKYQKKARAW